MPLTLAISFTQNNDKITGVVNEITANYGVGGNPNRADVANFLLWSKTSYDNKRVFTNPVTSLPFGQTSWSVDTSKDGWLEGILMSFTQWNNSDNYIGEIKVGEIVQTFGDVKYYTPLNKVFKAIANNSNIAPDAPNGSDYWEEISDLSVLIDYETVLQLIEDIYVDVRTNICVKDEFLRIYTKCGCKATLKDLEPAIQKWALYFSATLNFNNDAPEKMETIIRELETRCGC